MDYAGIATVLTAAAALVAAIATAAVKIIGALQENTRATVENTADRAVKSAETSAKLDTIVSALPPSMPQS